MKPPSNHELRDALVGDYKRNAVRVGATPDMAEIEALVLNDLTLVDRYESEAKPAPKKAAKPKKRVRSDELEKELQEKGMRAYVSGSPVERPKDIVTDQKARSPKAIALFARIKLILTPRGSIAKAAASGKDMHDALVECSNPTLAREFLEMWSWYVLLRGVKSLKNPFYTLNDGDAARKFIRGLEDICDRSNGWAGFNWYTK